MTRMESEEDEPAHLVTLPLASFERVHVGCDGKMAYASWDLAAKVIKSARYRVRRQAGERLEVYRCPHCRQWHVGNSAKTGSGRALGNRKISVLE